jgi:tetratricopeptide (TPR) repeat protein
MKNARAAAGVFFISTLLHACASFVPQAAQLRDKWPDDLPQVAEIADAPFFPQREFECGPAALATALAHFQVPTTADDLVPLVYLPARKGSLQAEMLAAPRRFGMVSYELAPRLEDLLREVADGTPVVVLQRLGSVPFEYWHYATAIGYNAHSGGVTTAIGYNAHSGGVTLRSGEQRDAWTPIGLFEYTWKKSAYWAIVTVPPNRIPVTADRARYLQAIVALEKTGQAKAAATAYATYLTRWPEEVGAGIGLGNAYYALGDLPSAERALRQALDKHPDSIVVMNNLAHTLSDLGRNSEALELIQRAAAAPGEFGAGVEETRDLIMKRLDQR